MTNDRDRISTRQLNRLRRRILRVYGTARREMQEQLTEFLAKYKALDERKRAQLDAGEITEDDYRIWLQNQVFQSDLMRAKLDGITQTCTTAQETAYKLARDEQYNIFSFGANWTFYELETSGYCCSVPGKGCFAVHTYRAQDDARRLSLEIVSQKSFIIFSGQSTPTISK